MASYISCPNANVAPIYKLGDQILEKYIPVYLEKAIADFNQRRLGISGSQP